MVLFCRILFSSIFEIQNIELIPKIFYKVNNIDESIDQELLRDGITMFIKTQLKDVPKEMKKLTIKAMKPKKSIWE